MYKIYVVSEFAFLTVTENPARKSILVIIFFFYLSKYCTLFE